MPHTVMNPKDFYAAILALIATAGQPVGLSKAPALAVPGEPENPTNYPYSVLHPLSDLSNEGSLPDPNQIVVWMWQVTCVSDSADGAQWMQHKVRQALQGVIPSVAGLGTTPIELFDGSGITRQDTPPPPLFYSADRFIAYTSA